MTINKEEKEEVCKFKQRIMEKAEWHGKYRGSSQYYDKPTMIWLEDVFQIINEAKEEFFALWWRRNQFGFDFDAKILEWFEKWFGSLDE